MGKEEEEGRSEHMCEIVETVDMRRLERKRRKTGEEGRGSLRVTNRSRFKLEYENLQLT